MYLLSSLYLFLSKIAKLCSYHIKSYTGIAVGHLLWYRSILQLYVCSKQCSKQWNEAHLSMPNFKMYTFVTLLRTKPPQSTHSLDSTLANIIQLRILKCSESSLNEGVFLLQIPVSVFLWTTSGAQRLKSHGQPYVKGQWKKNNFLCSQTTHRQVTELRFVLSIASHCWKFLHFSRLTSVMSDINSTTIRGLPKRRDMPILFGNGHIDWSSGSSCWLLRS